MSPSIEMQAAVYDRLTTYAPLADLPVIGSYSKPYTFPVLRFSAFIEMADDSAYTDTFIRVAFDVHAFARETGSVQARTLMAHVHNALRGWKPALPGMACIHLQYDGQTAMRDGADPSLSHGVISFEALVQIPEIEEAA